MSRRAGTALALVLVLAGTALATYPFWSQWIKQAGQEQLIVAQQQLVGQDGLAQQMESAQGYNLQLYESSVYVRDPFGQSSAQQLPQDYESQLNPLGDGVMGYLQIEAIDLQLPIYHGVSEEVLQKGVGHLPESSLPTGGENTHCVLSAHAGLEGQKLFSDLELLECGDTFTLQILGEQLIYQIDCIETVLPDALQSLAIQPGEDRVTLMTCTPYGINTHRLLVHAVRLQQETDVQQQSTSAPSRWMREYKLVLGTVVAVVAAGTVGAVLLRKKHS